MYGIMTCRMSANEAKVLSEELEDAGVVVEHRMYFDSHAWYLCTVTDGTASYYCVSGPKPSRQEMSGEYAVYSVKDFIRIVKESLPKEKMIDIDGTPVSLSTIKAALRKLGE